MGLFGDPNKKAKKLYNELIKSGADPNAYKSRKCCENCKYYTSIGYCNLSKKKTYKASCCNDWWGK